MKRLDLSPDLSLPADAITQTFGVLAVRGAGKSNLAAVMAEEMYAAGLPFVVVDPVGSWWGLRSAADGKGPGLSIPVFGGRHGDIPLEKTGGQMIADVVVADRLTCVLDLSELSEGDKTKFLIDFAERLYRKNTEPLHLFLEEADDYAPQRPFREQARLLGAWENVVRRGRSRGLGMTMITQRSASLNKNVLTQIETLFVLRTTSPQDRKAIAGWVEYHGQGRELLESLPELGPGEAWVWSPSYLKKLERVQIRRRHTFDSGATPKDVKGSRAPTKLADVNLAKLRDQMAATFERARDEDPKSLRLKISQLEREVRELKMNPATTIKVQEIPVFREEDIRPLQACAHSLEALQRDAAQTLALVVGEIDLFHKRLRDNKVQTPPIATAARPANAGPAGHRLTKRPASIPSTLPTGERRVLTAIAQHDAGVTREQLTVLTGYKRSSRDTYLQRLRERGFLSIEGTSILATSDGAFALGDEFEPLPKGDELRRHWLEKLPEGERRVLEILVGRYPNAVAREDLDEPTGYKRSSRDTYLQRLTARQLVSSSGRGTVRASEELFS